MSHRTWYWARIRLVAACSYFRRLVHVRFPFVRTALNTFVLTSAKSEAVSTNLGRSVKFGLRSAEFEPDIPKL